MYKETGTILFEPSPQRIPSTHRHTAADASPKPLKPLGKKFMKELFRTLKSQAYPIYALIVHLPIAYFAIECTYDYKRSVSGMEIETSDVYGLRGFLANAAAIHRYDEFRIRFGSVSMHYESEANRENFDRIYEAYLQYRCENAMRRNAPIMLDRNMISTYKLSKTDAECVRERLERINSAVREKLQREYDALKKLDCIRL